MQSAKLFERGESQIRGDTTSTAGNTFQPPTLQIAKVAKLYTPECKAGYSRQTRRSPQVGNNSTIRLFLGRRGNTHPCPSIFGKSPSPLPPPSALPSHWAGAAETSTPCRFHRSSTSPDPATTHRSHSSFLLWARPGQTQPGLSSVKDPAGLLPWLSLGFW